MADHFIPHFQNTSGHDSIAIGAHEFMCIGAKPPFDHPHIFLDMGNEHEIVCPYCSTLYKFDATLKAEEASPADCAWAPEAA
ncbi:zinc-finger domain-containing protein [Roseibium litorale]|uniref:Zinc-finger domain-containing protein n=1 Tax=Roseibium litorale TaxID=2803841 RepID=A0ABR9CHI8_9HYPH|nr:zinc-finger domain-containing protein [Roseibium litorale]MBD8890299.1 zinc-finger domain-containing protein [Roseibium litorale]